MATDLIRNIDRSRAIFTNLLKHLSSTDRDLHLARLADAYQERIDDVLLAIDGAPPSGRQSRPRISRVPEAPPAPAPVEPTPADAPTAHVHTPACDHVREAVASVDATVPGAIRAVLATETVGLLPRQIIEGVRVLRPETDETSVHGALFQMRKRGELAREGFHKNYRYRLTGQGALSGLGSGVVQMVANDAGGPTH